MPAFQPPEGPPGQLLRAVQTGRSQWKQDEAVLWADITAHTAGSAPAAARVSAAFLPGAHPGPRTGLAWRMRRTAGPCGVSTAAGGARGGLEAPGTPPSPCVLPEGLDWARAPGPPPPPCLFLTHRIFSLPHLGLLEQILLLSPVAAASAATCLGSLALFVRPVCWGLSSRATPDSPSLPLSGSLSPLLSSQGPSWLLWQRCSGYQVVVGGREPRVPQPPPFPMPGTLEAQWRGLMVGSGGALGASPGLAGFSLAMGGGKRGGMSMGVRI